MNVVGRLEWHPPWKPCHKGIWVRRGCERDLTCQARVIKCWVYDTGQQRFTCTASFRLEDKSFLRSGSINTNPIKVYSRRSKLLNSKGVMEQPMKQLHLIFSYALTLSIHLMFGYAFDPFNPTLEVSKISGRMGGYFEEETSIRM
jgi:hypothetical protein